MDWLYNLFLSGHGVGNAVIAICLVAIVGLAVGEIKIGAVKLGIAGPLFVGLAFGHFGLKMEPAILEFARDFGLILFVYAIGNAVGPSFFTAFKKEGALLNVIAVSIVVSGALIAVGIHFGFGVPLEVVVGLFSGGTTNTPSLAAGMEMLKELKASAPQIGTPGQAYAVAYPFGVVGILLTMGLVRMFFRINVEESAHSWAVGQNGGNEPVESMNIDVRNATAAKIFRDLEHVHAHSVVVSRVLHTGAQHMARDDEEIAVGDTILVDGPHSKLEELRNMLGAEAEIKLQDDLQGPIQTQRFVVTRSQMLGQHIFQSAQVGVAITRVNRGGVELSPSAAVRLQFGDQLTCVGEEAGLSDFAKLLGNDAKALQHTQMIPIFLGIFLGVLVGSLPIFVPGLPVPIKLGLAGGTGHRRDPSVAARAPWTSRLAHAGGDHQCRAGNRHQLVHVLRRHLCGQELRQHRASWRRPEMDALRDVDHLHPAYRRRRGCTGRVQVELPHDLRRARRRHDRSAGPGLRKRYLPFGCAGHKLCCCLSTDDVP